MAVISVNPFMLKNATLGIAADTYETGVTQVEFSPSVSASSVVTIDGVNHRGQGVAEWSCTIGFLQDLASNSLLRYLFANDGLKKTVTFTPVAGGPVITAALWISPATVGGTTSSDGSPLAATVTLAVDGKPSFSDTAVVPAVTGASPSGAGTGALVTITGSGFTAATAVKFASTAATAFTVVSDSTIVATMPSGSAGAAAITVTNAAGTSTAFAYTRAA